MKYNNRDLLDCENQIIGIEGYGGCTIKQYHAIILEMLKEIDNICKKNNIIYFLMYGSLIGAVRHHGFVPWDDDVDIILTRDNYLRFREACEKELSSEYAFISYDKDDNYGYLFSRIRKKHTTYIIRSEISKHGHHAGFYIDIMILDYLSDNPLYGFLQKRSLLALHRLINPGFSQGKEHLSIAEDIILKIIRIILGKKRAIRLTEKILGSAKEENSTKMISNYVVRSRYDFHIYNKVHFSRCCYVPFENYSLPIPYMPITLLNYNYYKAYSKKGILLEHKYEDEQKAVLERNYYYHNDIMYIPANRSRASHLEVFFDNENDSELYDQYYFRYLNKARNDKYAIKERYYNEKSAKYIAKMNENSKLAKMYCYEFRYKNFLKGYLSNKKTIEEMGIQDCIEVCDAATKLAVIEHENLTENEMLFTIWAFLKGSYLISAARLLKKTAILYPDDTTGWWEKLNQKFEELMKAYYAIFENDFNNMELFLNNHPQEEFFLVKYIKGVLAIKKGKYDEAKQIFVQMELMDKTQFWIQYYLGIIEWDKNRDVSAARQKFLNALDLTNYMPFLQMAIDKLKEIEGQC